MPLELEPGDETKLINMETLRIAPVVPLQALSACGEEGLTTIIVWWKMGPLVSSYEGDGLETR